MPEIITRKEALERGLKRYFTGKPCKHGHVSERKIGSGMCLSCDKKWKTSPEAMERFRIWLAKTPELRTKNRKKWDQERRRRVGDMIAVLREEMPDLLKEFGL